MRHKLHIIVEWISLLITGFFVGDALYEWPKLK